ncbi:hypothetical protein Bca52824_018736 [Brassica carinata]|uniref:Uncharacterized protein n=1 Tax=Brassica carinata TaxID=52824 RepID=A0A8X7VQ28_BRACI|nr:hypothetical protein Bca52824_018736 [Brassica carinata]
MGSFVVSLADKLRCRLDHSENFKSFTWKNVLNARGCWFVESNVVDIDKVYRNDTSLKVGVMQNKGNYERNVFQLYQTPHQHQPILMDTASTTQVDNMGPHFSNADVHNTTYVNWDELRSAVEFAFGPSLS